MRLLRLLHLHMPELLLHERRQGLEMFGDEGGAVRRLGFRKPVAEMQKAQHNGDQQCESGWGWGGDPNWSSGQPVGEAPQQVIRRRQAAMAQPSPEALPGGQNGLSSAGGDGFLLGAGGVIVLAIQRRSGHQQQAQRPGLATSLPVVGQQRQTVGLQGQTAARRLTGDQVGVGTPERATAVLMDAQG